MTSKDLERIEERRLQAQGLLDAEKSAIERNKWGQFATPPELARSMARYALRLLGETPVRFLDPALGTGSFYSALRMASPRRALRSTIGIELDTRFAANARDLWAGSGLDVIEGDFTRQQVPKERFNLILTNPPYVRHHHLSPDLKAHLKSRLARSLQLEISGLAGLYCYFLLLAHDWLDEEGLGIWLIPSEFMDVNYGSTVRRYLTESVTLLHIHRFEPSDVQFTDALVSSAIVVFRKAPPPLRHRVRFSLGGSIEEPHREAQVPLDTLLHSEKWTRFPESQTCEVNDGPTLGDLFAIKRGIATGANGFFILSPADVARWEIPSQFLKPILPNPRYLVDNVVIADDDGTPQLSEVRYLLDCAEPEEEIRERWPRFYQYLLKGREHNVHGTYLTSRRAPWYSQERRPPSPFLCTYMGRSGNGKAPFRFIWNRSQATAHNVYLLLYPKGPLRVALDEHPELEADVFRALQTITPSQMVSGGRVYGGGLHKVEPNELAQMPADSILESVGAYVRMERQANLFA